MQGLLDLLARLDAAARHPAGRVLGFLALAALALALGWNAHYRAIESPEERSDFNVFHAAARAMLDGGDIYAVKHPRGWEIYYPPGMPAAITPLGTLPIGGAVIAWFAITFAAFVWSCHRLILIGREIAGTGPGSAAAISTSIIMLAFANFGPTLSGFQRGQISALLVALMIEAFWRYRRGDTALAGMWIGIGAGLKVYPALLLIPMLVRREWRGLFASAAAVVVMWVALPMVIMGPSAGWDTTWRFVSGILLPLLTDSSLASAATFADINHFGRSNQSLFAFLGRWLCGGSLNPNEPFAWSIADWSTSTVRKVSQAASVAMILTMAWLALRRDDRRSVREAIIWSLPMLAANFISTIAWHHYYTVLVVPYALAAAITIRRDAGWAGVAVSSWIALLSNWAYFFDSPELSGSYALRQAGLLPLGSLLLWLALCAAAARRDPPTGDYGH